jgi:hypothetical protein
MPADTINLAGNMPPEMMAEQQQLNRQQRLADLLTQQGMQQMPAGSMVSGRYVPTSPFQHLAQIANMAAGQYIGKKGDEEAMKLAERIRQGRASAEEKIINLAFGTPDTATEMAGPYAGKVPMPVEIKEGAKPNLAAAVREINSPYSYGAGKDLKPLIYKQLMPDPTELERNWKAAQKQGYTGTINDYKNQMTEDQKESNRIARARLNLSAQEQSFNTGMPIGGVSNTAPQNAFQVNPQAPLRTIGVGNPILAPNQQVAPQQNTMPQQVNMTQTGQLPYRNKAEQDVYIATQKEKNKLQLEAQDKLPAAINTVNSGLKAITGMIGDTTVDAQGNLVYGKIPPHKGFNDAVGFPSFASGFGASSFIKGSDWKNFEARFKEIEGKSFLSAIDSLRGTGAISEVEGTKATSAINRMSLSQSPAEFVEAANELRSVMTKGYAASQQRAGVTPVNYGAQPTAGGTSPKLRYDLSTGEWK